MSNHIKAWLRKPKRGEVVTKPPGGAVVFDLPADFAKTAGAQTSVKRLAKAIASKLAETSPDVIGVEIRGVTYEVRMVEKD